MKLQQQKLQQQNNIPEEYTNIPSLLAGFFLELQHFVFFPTSVRLSAHTPHTATFPTQLRGNRCDPGYQYGRFFFQSFFADTLSLVFAKIKI
ncbi:hypothetical protein [Chryseobacterium koreense]|uniref:hypothetical protein n=1 Tax=Chryseobacterium koreense TaxID=232216 RepID=UPI00128BB176|nr:hypothetical protein [Chryseobacterium koreense]MBB5332202.1 hypothetical protein [Chryseobacterium koreense]